MDVTLEPGTSNYHHQCYICDKIFSASCNLYRHLRKIHNESVESPYNNVKCAICELSFLSSSSYTDHLERDHDIKLEIEKVNFVNQKCFEEWKLQIENETTSQYIKSRGGKKSSHVNKIYYSCNRSGYYVSKARTQKSLKKQGSRKINGRCPASINVTVHPDSSYHVRFVKTHVGHKLEVKHLVLSSKDRELIIKKLSEGRTKKDIIRQIRSSVELRSTTNLESTISSLTNDCEEGQSIVITTNSSLCGNDMRDNLSIKGDTKPAANNAVSDTRLDYVDNITSTPLNMNEDQHTNSRLYLATTKDIYNIINSKNLNSKLIRHNYDLNNVGAWMREMECSHEICPIIYYKPQSIEADPVTYPTIKNDDFILVLMKGGQMEILKKFYSRCIMIDSTHNVYCEHLQLTSVSVTDDNGDVCPVAFMLSNRTDVDTLSVLFSLIRDKVGPLSTKIFIADVLDDFYQAWTQVMKRPTHNLLTPWCVFDLWSKNFHLVKSKDKLRKLKKRLRALITEQNQSKFNSALSRIIDDNRLDPDVNCFVKKFEEDYAKNPDLWSDCLRQPHGITNSQLWTSHDKFKSIYKEGKTSRNLCKYIACLMNFYDETQLSIMSEAEMSQEARMNVLIERHKKSDEIGSLTYEVAVEPVYWLCPSEGSNEVYHEIRMIRRPEPETTSCCDLKCPICEACRHSWKCTCLDYVVNLNVCKHIHKICTMCKE